MMDNFIVVHFTDPFGNYGSVSLTVTRLPASNISGRVVATNDEPLGFSDPNIEMHLIGENIESYAEMDSDGIYSFTCIPDGLYTITISSAVSYNYWPESHTVIVSDGDVSGVDFVVETYLITGKVVNTKGVAIGYSYPRIEPHLKGENIESYAMVDSDGSYSFTWIPDGSYTISLASTMDYNYEPQSHTVIVNNGNVSGIDFIVGASFVHGSLDSLSCTADLYIRWSEGTFDSRTLRVSISSGEYHVALPPGLYGISINAGICVCVCPELPYQVFLGSEDVYGINFKATGVIPNYGCPLDFCSP
jgi:hypothetical protein